MISERSTLSLIVLLVGVGLFVHTFSLGFADLGGAFSPVFFPRIILGGWILLAFLSLIVDVIGKSDQQPGRWPTVLLIIIALFAYIALLQPIGFFASSVMFCALCLLCTGQRRARDIILFSLLLPGSLVLLFNHLLTMPLPVSGVFWWI